MNNLVLGRCMAQATRGLLFTAFALVVGVAMMAGLNSGEYALTLALGAMLATLVGIGFMMQAGTSSPPKGIALSGTQPLVGNGQTMEVSDSLPDPMDQDFEMPL